jgi:hypothetical protein
MATLLLVDGHAIAKVSDPRYESLLANAAILREQLEIATFIIDHLPDVNIDTSGMHRVLEETK